MKRGKNQTDPFKGNPWLSLKEWNRSSLPTSKGDHTEENLKECLSPAEVTMLLFNGNCKHYPPTSLPNFDILQPAKLRRERDSLKKFFLEAKHVHQYPGERAVSPQGQARLACDVQESLVEVSVNRGQKG